MPHCHSQQKLQERRERAQRRGYLRRRSDAQRFIAVPDDDIYNSMKPNVQIMVEHRRLNQLTGQPHHFAVTAARAAEDKIGTDATK